MLDRSFQMLTNYEEKSQTSLKYKCVALPLPVNRWRNSDLKSVESERNIIRKFLFHIGMQPQPVADVREVGVVRLNRFNHVKGLCQVKV